MKGRWITYSPAELSFIESRRSMPRRELYAAFVETFGRDDVSQTNLTALCKRNGWLTGRDGRFQSGLVPANKGRKCAPGTGGLHPNARATQFRKGNQPHTYRGPGHESVCPNGYIYLIVAETNPHTRSDTRRVLKHKWLWEKANGPVPEGMALKCRDGNRKNTDPDNWFPVSRALLPRLGGRFGRGYDSAPAELKPTILAIAKLEQAAKGAKP